MDNNRDAILDMRKTTLACAATVLFACVWLMFGQTVEHASGGALPQVPGLAAAASPYALSDAAAPSPARPTCGTAASPFAVSERCKNLDPSAIAAEERGVVQRVQPARGEDVERALRQSEAGNALALSPYVDLRSRCLEQGHQNGHACFSNEGLAALDARFLQTAGQMAQAGNAEAQLALVTWWRLRAYHLLEADPVASQVEWDEPEEKLVARAMGNSQFADAMRNSREMYDRLAADDPSKAGTTRYLEEYKRYGIVTGGLPVR